MAGRSVRAAPRVAGLAILVCAALLAGCALPALPPALGLGVPTRVSTLEVPFEPQRTRECGPASLRMLLAWGGEAPAIDTLVAQTWTPGRGGALAHDLVAGARRHGRLAFEIRGELALLRELAAGHPVLVMQNLRLAFWPMWHFAVAIGYDLEAREVIVHSGGRQARRVPLKLFRRTWRRADAWGLLALPPDRLPATAGPSGLLRAAAALEGAGQADAAAVVYRRAATRWPRSALPPLALGNLLRSRGDLDGAERAIREAVARAPRSGAARNNLADVLLLRGELGAAREAIERAIELEGPQPTYLRTRAEIEAAGRGRVP